MKEIERKFLIRSLPDLSNAAKYEIEQVYLRIKPERRIRKENNKYYYTEKSEGFLVREENEREITEEEYNELKKDSVSNIIKKTRYVFFRDGYLLELDIYRGLFEGLVTVEVEFETKEEALEFEPFEFFGQEITYDSNYKNKYLSYKFNNYSGLTL